MHYKCDILTIFTPSLSPLHAPPHTLDTGLLPTEAELKRIDKLSGSTHPAELFMQAVMMFYPDLPLRLTCFSACLNFGANCEAVLGRSRKLINACNQVSDKACECPTIIVGIKVQSAFRPCEV